MKCEGEWISKDKPRSWLLLGNVYTVCLGGKDFSNQLPNHICTSYKNHYIKDILAFCLSEFIFNRVGGGFALYTTNVFICIISHITVNNFTIYYRDFMRHISNPLLSVTPKLNLCPATYLLADTHHALYSTLDKPSVKHEKYLQLCHSLVLRILSMDMEAGQIQCGRLVTGTHPSAGQQHKTYKKSYNGIISIELGHKKLNLYLVKVFKKHSTCPQIHTANWNVFKFCCNVMKCGKVQSKRTKNYVTVWQCFLLEYF